MVRAEVGFPPLVTPMSQIVGTQAVLNVLSGKRWHIVPDEMKQYLRGHYGAAPGPVSLEILERVLGDEQPITVRPADLVDETFERLRRGDGRPGARGRGRAQLRPVPAVRARLPGTPPHRPGVRRLRHPRRVPPAGAVERSQPGGRRPRAGDPRLGRAERRRRGDHRRGRPAGDRAQGGPAPRPSAAPAPQAAALTATATPVHVPSNGYHAVRSPMVGTFYRSSTPSNPPFVEVGDQVKVGQTLCILEAMKLMNELASDVDGVVREIKVENGAAVEYGQVLFDIETA